MTEISFDVSDAGLQDGPNEALNGSLLDVSMTEEVMTSEKPSDCALVQADLSLRWMHM